MKNALAKYLILLALSVVIAIPVGVLIADFQRLQAIETHQPTQPAEPPLLGQTPMENDPPAPSPDSIKNFAAVTSLEERMKRQISIEFRKTAIEHVLRILADQADVDIVKGPNVTGEVSVTFTDVPFDQALNFLLSPLGCTYQVTGDAIWVTKLDELSAGRYPTRSSPATSSPQPYTAGAVTAIVNSDNPCALIQGQIVHKGDTINGIKVVRIEKGKVHFEKDGKTWTQVVEAKNIRQPTLLQRPTLIGQIPRESVLREIDRMWNQEYEMIKRWWSIEEEQAKSLPTTWLRENYDRQAWDNFRQRDGQLKGKYSAIKKEAANIPAQVDAGYLQELWRAQEQQLQARATQWQRNRNQELDQIWASYEQQRKHDALVQEIDQLNRQVQQGQEDQRERLRDLERQVQSLEWEIRSR